MVDLDCRVFAIALVLTPFLFGLSGVILLGYGVFITGAAAVLGLPAYLLGGIPAAVVAITRMPERSGRASIGSIVGAGLCAHLLTTALFALVVMMGPFETAALVAFLPSYLMFGLIAAPLEALIFALIYRRYAEAPLWRSPADLFT